MRTVWASRLGARAARMAKIMKCLVAFHDRKHGEFRPSDTDARRLNAKLVQKLSTKVSMLTIVLVLGVPLFSIGRYPESDLSMQAWTSRLENDYDNAYGFLEEFDRNGTMTFFKTVDDLMSFYADLSYFLFKM